MDSDLVGLWNNLPLTENEREGVVVEADELVGDERRKWWLVGKLYTTRPFNKNVMITTLKLIWKLAHEVHIAAVEDNFFLFKFTAESDRDRVLEGAPWSFDKHLLLLSEFDGDLRPEEYSFQKAPFWIRIYDLPLGMRSTIVAEKIGQKIGRLLQVDGTAESDG